MPYEEVAEAIRTVRQSETAVAVKLGFEFLVLTASRSGEVRGARWEEIDREVGEWRIPAERMKHKREHRVPLSSRAQEILAEAKQICEPRRSEFWHWQAPCTAEPAKQTKQFS